MNWLTETVFFALFVIALVVVYPFIFTGKDDDDDT